MTLGVVGKKESSQDLSKLLIDMLRDDIQNLRDRISHFERVSQLNIAFEKFGEGKLTLSEVASEARKYLIGKVKEKKVLAYESGKSTTFIYPIINLTLIMIKSEPDEAYEQAITYAKAELEEILQEYKTLIN